MTTGSILLAISLLMLVGLYLARPFLVPEAAFSDPSAIEQARQQLHTQKEALLAEIKQLDFDHETGVIPAEVYARQRPQLMQQAAALLQHIDRLPDADVDEAIEAAVAHLRQAVVVNEKYEGEAAAAPPATVHASPASPTSTVNFCAQCGQRIDPGDKFCAQCGRQLITA